MDQRVKNPPAMRETTGGRVGALGREDTLEEEGMATHSSILAWRIPWTEEPGGIQSKKSQSDTTERLSPRGRAHTHTHTHTHTHERKDETKGRKRNPLLNYHG